MKKSALTLSILISTSIACADEAPSFGQLDINQDGFISHAEVPTVDFNAFDHADGNLDGKLTTKEFNGYRHYQKRIADDDESIPLGTKILKDIEYVENGDRRHKLDLYYPADHDGDTPTQSEVKVVVNITYPFLNLHFDEFKDFWRFNKILDRGNKLNETQMERLTEINAFITGGEDRNLKFY